MEFCTGFGGGTVQKCVAVGVFRLLPRGVLQGVRKKLENKRFRYSRKARNRFFDAKVAP
jgi:hypothetical protein